MKPLEFFFALNRNLEDVDSFYNRKQAESIRRLHLLRDRYSPALEAGTQMDQDEREELIAALLELWDQFRNLQWFGEINRRGFIKITKKLDKKVPNVEKQQRYIATKVDPKPFCEGHEHNACPGRHQQDGRIRTGTRLSVLAS
jgi:glycerophosphodiester phosphodiesterase